MCRTERMMEFTLNEAKDNASVTANIRLGARLKSRALELQLVSSRHLLMSGLGAPHNPVHGLGSRQAFYRLHLLP